MSLEEMAKVFDDRDALSERSDLSLIINKELEDMTHQLILELICREGVVTARVAHGYGTGEDEEGGELDMEDYLELWKEVRAGGFPAWAMTGQTLPPGVEIYLTGHAGPLQLGWIISTTLEGVRTHAPARALCEALFSFVLPRSDLFEAHMQEFLGAEALGF